MIDSAAVAADGIVSDGDRILLMRRAGSGYHDGELRLPTVISTAAKT